MLPDKIWGQLAPSESLPDPMHHCRTVMYACKQATKASCWALFASVAAAEASEPSPSSLLSAAWRQAVEPRLRALSDAGVPLCVPAVLLALQRHVEGTTPADHQPLLPPLKLRRPDKSSLASSFFSPLSLTGSVTQLRRYPWRTVGRLAVPIKRGTTWREHILRTISPWLHGSQPQAFWEQLWPDIRLRCRSSANKICDTRWGSWNELIQLLTAAHVRQYRPSGNELI